MELYKIRNLNKSFGKHNVFTEFSLEVRMGEFLCITGPSGCGKSTLLNMLGMFDTPDSGTISFMGEPLPHMNSRAGRNLLKDKILYLFQNYALVDDRTVAYNLSIPMLQESYSPAQKKCLMKKALENVGLSVPLSTKIYQLSGGEQQRLSLARGFLRKFEVVLADEPTGSLDAQNRDVVISHLRTFVDAGKSVIIVTHDPAVAAQADRIIEL